MKIITYELDQTLRRGDGYILYAGESVEESSGDNVYGSRRIG